MTVPAWSTARRLRLALALAATVTGPSVLSAQVAVPARDEAASRSHTVRPGDTLWDLARQYLGDPFQWPQIFRLNPEVIEDPHWIYPGEVLQLPGSAAIVAAAPAGGGDASGTTALTTPADDPGPQGPETPTIFASAAVRQSNAPRGATVAIVRGPTIRRGEFESAPVLMRQPAGAGRLLRAVDVNSMLSQGTLDLRRFQLRERIAIQPPTGKPAAVGDLFIAFRMGPSVDGRDVVVPTGVIRVDEIASGRAPTATLVREFESVTQEHRLMPYAAWSADSLRPVPVNNGRTTRLIGVFGNELAPSLQNFVFFPLSTRDGVKPGDQLQLYREAQRDGGTTIPEIELAMVTLVRVTDQGATGIVLTQTSSRFEAGTAARIVARMP
jgi:LysM repeat protein